MWFSRENNGVKFYALLVALLPVFHHLHVTYVLLMSVQLSSLGVRHWKLAPEHARKRHKHPLR